MGTNAIEWATNEERGRPGRVSDGAASLILLKHDDTSKRHAKILELYDAFHASIYKYLRSLGMSPDESEDVIQEVFLRLASHLLKEGNEDENLRAWLFRVAHNCSMDVHRRHGKLHAGVSSEDHDLEEVADADENPELIYLQKEHMSRVRDAMAKLTVQQRNSLLLRSEGLRYQEIGAVLGVSESRAIYLVKRGLQHLAGYL